METIDLQDLTFRIEGEWLILVHKKTGGEMKLPLSKLNRWLLNEYRRGV